MSKTLWWGDIMHVAGRTRMLLASLLFLWADHIAAEADSGRAASPTKHIVSVAQHAELANPVTDAEVDGILDQVSRMLTAETPGCPIQFVRDGSVHTFNSAQYPFSINSSADFSKFKSAPPSIKIVGEINWCGVLQSNILGCSSTPGAAWTVVRSDPSSEPILWAHEFAHTSGSSHRDVPRALMRPMLFPEDKEINSEECAKIVAGSPAVNTGVAGAGIDGPPSTSADEGAAQPATDSFGSSPPQATPEPVTSFVRGKWVEGVPFNRAKLYTDNDIPALSEILNNPQQATLWSTAVSTLGAIGSLRAKSILMEFLLRDPNGQLSASEYQGKSTVPVALGWIVQRSKELSHEPDRDALETLIRMTDGTWWTETAKINWTTTIFKNRQDLIASLVVKSFIGLALSGTEEARVRLLQVGKSAEGRPSAPSDFEAAIVTDHLGPSILPHVSNVSPTTDSAVKNNGGNGFVAEMLKENADVKARGLESYYGR